MYGQDIRPVCLGVCYSLFQQQYCAIQINILNSLNTQIIATLLDKTKSKTQNCSCYLNQWLVKNTETETCFLHSFCHVPLKRGTLPKSHE